MEINSVIITDRVSGVNTPLGCIIVMLEALHYIPGVNVTSDSEWVPAPGFGDQAEFALPGPTEFAASRDLRAAQEEIDRLRELVREAFNEGFDAGLPMFSVLDTSARPRTHWWGSSIVKRKLIPESQGEKT